MIHCCESKTGTQRHLEGVGNVTVEDLNDLGVLRLLGTRRFEAANWGSSWRNRMGSKPDPMLSAPNPPLLSYFSKDHSDNSWLSCLLLCLWFLILWPSCCFCSTLHMLVLLGWPQGWFLTRAENFEACFWWQSGKIKIPLVCSCYYITSLLLKSLLSRFAKGVFESVSAARRKQ